MKVMFRLYKRSKNTPLYKDKILALFPDNIETSHGLILCYDEVTQHGSCNLDHMIRTTTKGDPIAGVKMLEAAGYKKEDLEVRERR